MALKSHSPGPAELIAGAKSFSSLRHAVQKCRGCDIWQRATQAVFGEGSENSEVMLVGEQPGNKEDLAGQPFVGPAGTLLDQALAEAGIRREKVYVTNVVKHFNSTQRGKLRIHKKPNSEEIGACHPWLEAEISRIRPKVIVCLGATAAKALIGRDFLVTRDRGRLIKSNLAPILTATIHPASILRTPDDNDRHAEMAQFVSDLRKIAAELPSSALISRPSHHSRAGAY